MNQHLGLDNCIMLKLFYTTSLEIQKFVKNKHGFIVNQLDRVFTITTRLEPGLPFRGALIESSDLLHSLVEIS